MTPVDAAYQRGPPAMNLCVPAGDAERYERKSGGDLRECRIKLSEARGSLFIWHATEIAVAFCGPDERLEEGEQQGAQLFELEGFARPGNHDQAEQRLVVDDRRVRGDESVPRITHGGRPFGEQVVDTDAVARLNRPRGAGTGFVFAVGGSSGLHRSMRSGDVPGAWWRSIASSRSRSSTGWTAEPLAVSGL